MKHFLSIFALACCIPWPLLGQFVAPSDISSSTSSDLFPVSNLVDGSGLVDELDDPASPFFGNHTSLVHEGFSATNAWVTDAPDGGGSDYFAGANPNPILICEFPSVLVLNQMEIWGYFLGPSGTNGNEARVFQISFSTDGGNTFPGSTLVFDSIVPIGQNRVSLDLGGRSANVVQIEITDNHFGSDTTQGGGDRVGLGEIGFIAEPQTVTNNGDSGNGSLRDVLASAPRGGVINFDAGLSGETISPASLITIFGSVLVDASSLEVPITIDGSGIPDQFTISCTTLSEIILDSFFMTGGNDSFLINNQGSSLMIRNSVIAGNRAVNGATGTGGSAGGGIFNRGDLILDHCTVSSNQAGTGGSGSSDGNQGENGGDGGNGGGLFNLGTATILSSTFEMNSSGDGGAGGFGNFAPGSGGSGGDGGAIYNSGDLTIRNSTISGNESGSGSDGGGTISSGANGGSAGEGGGIFNTDSGSLSIRNSTIHGNVTGDGGDGSFDNNGTGGLAGHGGGISNHGGLLIQNVTITANGLGIGGLNGGGDITPRTGQKGGGLYVDNDSLGNFIQQSLIADNAFGVDDVTGPDIGYVAGTILPSGVNFIGNNETAEADFPEGFPNASDDLVGTSSRFLEPLLGGLADNGGPTLTVLPFSASPVIDPPNAVDFSSQATDQRGFPRVAGPRIDIGAVEVQPVVVPPAAAPVAAVNDILKVQLTNKIKKLKKKAKAAKKKGKKAKAKKLKGKIKKLNKRLKSL